MVKVKLTGDLWHIVKAAAAINPGNIEEVQDFCDLKLKGLLFDQFVNDSNFAPDLEYVTGEDYDFLVIISSLNKIKIRVDKSRVIGLLYEPPFYQARYDANMGAYCGIVYTCANKKYYPNNENYVTAPSVLFYNLLGKIDGYLQNDNFTKPKKLSICASDMQGNEMYDFRRELVHKIIESKLDCDIYGKGWEFDDPRCKGAPENKADALLPYQYSISVENSIYNGYVTEKLFDCFLANTCSLYYGSESADTLYNPKSFLRLPYTNDMPRLIEWLEHLVHEPVDFEGTYRKTITESKNRYFTRYNLYNIIKQTVYRVTGER